jgi:hypothetical protein
MFVLDSLERHWCLPTPPEAKGKKPAAEEGDRHGSGLGKAIN